jgi:thioester reductase-like protein
MATVLVTGFPTVLARQLVREIFAARPHATLRLVVRAKFADECRRALEALSPSERERVRVYDGDVAALDFGLSGAEYKELAREVTHIHHAAHVSYTGVDRETAESVNVDGTKEALEFARMCERLEVLVHHSTALVSGTRSGVVTETDLDAGQGFRTVVEETRARAEKLVRRHQSALPIVIVRPSNIVGHSVTGEIDRTEGVYLLAGLLLDRKTDFAFPLPANGARGVHLVPVDYVACAAVALGFRRSAVGRTFHLVDPSPPSTKDIVDELSHLCGRAAPRGFVSSNVARAVLRAPGLQRLAPGPVTLLTELASDVEYACDNARAELEPLGITCPRFHEYAPNLIEIAAQSRRPSEPPPSTELEAARAVDAALPS